MLQLQVVVTCAVVLVDVVLVEVVVVVHFGTLSVPFGTQSVDVQSPEPVAQTTGWAHSQLGAAVLVVLVVLVSVSLGHVHSPSAMQKLLYTEKSVPATRLPRIAVVGFSRTRLPGGQAWH